MVKIKCPSDLFELAIRRGGLLRTSELVAAGFSAHQISSQVANGTLRRCARGVIELPDAVAQNIARHGAHQHNRIQQAYIAVLAAGPTAAAAGQSALVILGAQGLPPIIRAEFTTKCGGTTGNDAKYHNRREPYSNFLVTNQVRVLPPELALAQAVANLPRNHAVAVMDHMRRSNLLNPAGFELAEQLSAHRPGAALTRPWWRLSDQRADSPAETFGRLTCHDLNCAPDVLQLKVFNNRGSYVARVDMAWQLPDGRWLLGEIDGFKYHSSAAQLQADHHRQNQLIAPNTMLQRWRGADAADGTMASQVQRILRGAKWRPGQVTSLPGNRIQLVAS